MFEKIKAAFLVLQKGRELKNPEIWKNVQALTLTLTAMLAGVVPFLPFNVPQEIIDQLGAGLASLFVGGFAAFQLYITVASSKKVGLPSGSAAGSDPVQPGTAS